MKRIHYVNAFSGVAQVTANIVLTIIIVPVFIKKLGLQTYGVYALISTIGQLGVFTNFGFNTTVVKYLAEQSDRRESNYDIVVTAVVIGVAAISVALLAYLSRDFILFHLLNLSREVVTSSVYVFFASCILTNVLVVVGQIPSAVLDSQQKVYLTNSVQLGVGVLGKLLMLGVLLVSPDLGLIGVSLTASSAFGLILFALLARRTWGVVSVPSLRTEFFRVARKHLKYGRSVYATAVTGFFYEPITKILLNHYLGLAEVGFFDIALRVKTIILSFAERLLYPVLPLLAAKHSFTESRSIHDEVQQKLFILVIPAIIAVIFIARPLVNVWLGPAFSPVIVGIACIASCYLLAQTFVPLYQFLLVKGHPDKTFVMQIANVTVNSVLFLLIVPHIGYFGAIVAFCAAILSSIGLSIWYQSSILHSKLLTTRAFAAKCAWMAGILSVLNGVSVLLVRQNWPQMVALLIANGIGTIAVFRLLKMFSISDIDQYVGHNNRAAMVLERILVARASGR